MNQKLQEMINCAPLVKQMTGVDAAICVWNTDAVAIAFFKAEKLEFEFEVGYQVEDKNDPICQVLRTGKTQYNRVPKEVFGTAIEGSIVPIFDGTEVVGAVTYVVSGEEKDHILESADRLSNSISKTDTCIAEITKGTGSLASNMEQVQKISDMVKAQVDQAARVVKEIQKNANYSNILALNASIESARAGQAGKGFAVVSDEMRKFSKLSGDAAAKINANLQEIEKSLAEVKQSIDSSTTIASEQAEAASQLSEMFESVSDVANTVADICRNVKHM